MADEWAQTGWGLLLSDMRVIEDLTPLAPLSHRARGETSLSPHIVGEGGQGGEVPLKNSFGRGYVFGTRQSHRLPEGLGHRLESSLQDVVLVDSIP